jgi:aspartate aminotransferase
VINWKKMYVIIDEVYEKLVYDGFRFASFASIDEEVKKRTITVNGVSKAYAMTGWRIGYAAGPSDIINAMNKIQGHSTSNASTISQYAALEALTGTQEEVDKMRLEFEKRRNFFYKSLDSIAGINCLKPQGAFFVFPNVLGLLSGSSKKSSVKNSLDLSLSLLNKHNLVTVQGSAFGAEGFIRITYAASMKKLKEAVNRINSAVNDL